ncbi:MAG TPA: serine hydrolase [Saprospiraceae bacterium]|nr:serine hydrolase [Saprospiraceae bacterium]
MSVHEIAKMIDHTVLHGILLCLCLNCQAQPKTDSLLQELLYSQSNPILQNVINHKDSFRLQIIYTQINRDKHNKSSFENYYFNTDTNLYFNPASTVKLPLALLALEKLNTLNIRGADKYAPLQIDSNYQWQTSVYTDSTAQNGLPSLAHYIKKAFLVSDNDAYNRLYQFVGQQSINRGLHVKGYPCIRITRQFLGLTLDENRHTNGLHILHPDGRSMYDQPSAYNPDPFYFEKEIKIGHAYFNSHDSLIHEPIDFTRVNNLPLEDLQQLLKAVMFPESLPPTQRFKLSKDDYRFLYQYLSQYPSETNYPKYDTAEYYDSYVKFFFRSDNHRMPPFVRVFNKVGWAYGFLIDASYVADFMNDVEYMLSAVVYVNSDGILNDDRYEYEETGWPFMYQLGQTIYQYELARPRTYKPNLKRFKIQYERRDAKDTRPTIKNVDN